MSISLESKIYQLAISKNQHPLESENNEFSCENTDDESEYEEVEEMDEMEMLKILDEQEDPLLVCKRIVVPSTFNNSVDCENPVEMQHMKAFDKYGLYTYEEFIDYETVAILNRKAMEMFSNGELLDSIEKGNENDPFRDHSARTDYITWIKKSECSPEFIPVISKMENYFHKFFPSLLHSEIQLACYPGNYSFYKRHRDAFPSDDISDTEQRRITAILYLNPEDWTDEDGGYLRIHRTGIEQDIKPTGGRLVVFLSGVIDHEVLPTKRHRTALTFWFR